MDGQENKEQSKRAMLSERMRKKYPELNVDDDEIMSGQIMDDYDNLEKENGAYRDREDKLAEMFTSDPKSAYYMSALRDGGDPALEMMKTFGDEFFDALNDPEKQEEFASARKEYVDRVTKSRAMEEEAENNLEQSLARAAERVDAGELDETKVDDAYLKLVEIANNVLMNKFTDEDVDLVLKGMGYDNAVKEAGEVGEVRGRNAKIDERLRKSKKGDGISMMDGKNSAVQQQRRAPRDVFELAKGAM